MNDKDFNELLSQVRSCLMPTHPIEELFNLTLKVERPIRETDKAGGLPITGWELIGDALKGALDDYCQNDSGAPFALYCSGDTEVKQGDRISFNDRNDQLVKLEVTAVKNPMMHYRYLVVWCKSDRRSH